MKLKPGNQYEIGQYLVSEGLLSAKQLDTVFSMQKATGGSLAALGGKMGFAEEENLTKLIARALGVEAVDIHSLVIPDVLVRKIPREVLKRHQVLPVGMRGGALQLATSDPTDYSAIEEVQFLTDMPVEICLAARSGIQEGLEEFFSSEDAMQEDLRKFLTGGEAKSMDEAYGGLSPEDVHRALVPLLVEKGIISIGDLLSKAQEMRGS